MPVRPSKTSLHTYVLPSIQQAPGLSGQTVWVAEMDGQTAAVAWDWVAIQPTVLALQAPLSIVSNLKLVDDVGDQLPESDAIVFLNQLIYGLAWQSKVRRHLRASTYHSTGCLPRAALSCAALA